MAGEDDHDLEVHQSGADASLVIPKQAGDLKKGELVMIKGHPCKIVETATSKTGKHGHAKITYVGIDIFTGKKYDGMDPTSHNVEVPVVDRQEYLLANVEKDDGIVELIEQKTGQLCTVRMSNETENDTQLNEQLISMFENDKEVLVSVLRAMKQEAIVSVREQLSSARAAK